MSVSSMKKLTVFAHARDADRAVLRLMRCRCVDIAQSEAEAEGMRVNLCEAERIEQEQKVARIADALVILHKHCGKAPLVKLRQEIDRTAFCADGSQKEAWYTVERVEEITARLIELRSERTRAETVLAQLAPWRGYDLPLSLTGTSRARVVQGTFPPKADPDYLRDSLASDGVHCEFLGADERAQYAVLMFHRADEDKLGLRLAELGFLRVTLGDGSETPAAEIDRARRTLRWLNDEEKVLETELAGLADKTSLVEVLADVEQTTLTVITTRERMVRTENCVMLTGWLPSAAEQKVAAALDRFDCAWEITDPEEGDDVPILLQNNGFAANFEWVLGMYSYPKYGTFDPTFVMSIFYFIIFGIMFADVGYGLLLVLGCFGGIALLKPREGMKRFLAMFGYCGISSIIWGIILGSYFGDLPKMFITKMLGLNPPGKIAVWFDPLEDPMTFLVLSLAVGAVHLLGGMAVQFYILCREGKPLDALMDVGSWWVVFAGIALLVIKPDIGTWVLIAGLACIILTQGRHKKGIVGRLFGGVAKLYDLVSYMSDLLSYSRILALGLAAAVIAQVVNILGTLKGGTVVGYILFILVFLIGHGLNLVINVLGTFVHTSRLQYIEFFNKFYVDGGRPFKPALPAETYTVEPEQSGAEPNQHA